MDEHFHPANELERALVRAATDPTARPAFYRKLLSSQLFLLTPDTSLEAPTRVARPGEQVELISFGDSEGSFLPIFSSRERVTQVVAGFADATGGDVPPYACLAMHGRDAFALIGQAPTQAVLNPGLPFARPFSADQIRAIADGSILGGESITIGTMADVRLAQPAVYPQTLVDALRQLFAGYPSVEAAFLAQIDDKKSALPPHPIIGIVGLACADAVEEAGMIASEIVQGPVDLVEIEPDELHGLAGRLRHETAPFYVRSPSSPAEQDGL